MLLAGKFSYSFPETKTRRVLDGMHLTRSHSSDKQHPQLGSYCAYRQVVTWCLTRSRKTMECAANGSPLRYLHRGLTTSLATRPRCRVTAPASPDLQSMSPLTYGRIHSLHIVGFRRGTDWRWAPVDHLQIEKKWAFRGRSGEGTRARQRRDAQTSGPTFPDSIAGA